MRMGMRGRRRGWRGGRGDVEFDGKDIGDICKLNDSLKRIVGVLDTSLFYNIATKALVASENGIRIIECER